MRRLVLVCPSNRLRTTSAKCAGSGLPWTSTLACSGRWSATFSGWPSESGHRDRRLRERGRILTALTDLLRAFGTDSTRWGFDCFHPPQLQSRVSITHPMRKPVHHHALSEVGATTCAAALPQPASAACPRGGPTSLRTSTGRKHPT